MSDYDDRGPYAPRHDEPLSFDPRRPQARGGPAPTMLIVSAVILVIIIVAGVLFYRSGVRKDGEAPRVVGEPVGEIATPPAASAQPADMADKLDVYGAEGPPQAETATAYAPEPEQPIARVQAPAPAPVQPAAAPAAAKPAPLRAAPTAEEVDAVDAEEEAAAPPSKAAKPAAKPAEKPAPERATTAGGASVQIGAFSNAAQADKGWNDAARALPGQMAGRGKRVEKVDVGGTTFHRTYVTGFASKAEAQKFCSALKAAGKSCIVR